MKKPENVKLISTRWVFTIKYFNFKASFVDKRFIQQDYVKFTETYTPIGRLSTFRLFDVQTTFYTDSLKPPNGVLVHEGRC